MKRMKPKQRSHLPHTSTRKTDDGRRKTEDDAGGRNDFGRRRQIQHRLIDKRTNERTNERTNDSFIHSFIHRGRITITEIDCRDDEDDDDDDDGDETAGGSRFSGVECVFIVRQRRGLRREWTSGELFMYVSTFIHAFIRDDASRAREWEY